MRYILLLVACAITGITFAPQGPKDIKKTLEGILPIGTSVDYALLEKLKITLEYRFYFVRTHKLGATSGRRLINPKES